MLLTGDAAGLINPLTGEGIFYAVLSGALAGAAAHLGPDAGAAYRRALGARLGRTLRHLTAASQLSGCPRSWTPPSTQPPRGRRCSTTSSGSGSPTAG